MYKQQHSLKDWKYQEARQCHVAITPFQQIAYTPAIRASSLPAPRGSYPSPHRSLSAESRETLVGVDTGDVNEPNGSNKNVARVAKQTADKNRTIFTKAQK